MAVVRMEVVVRVVVSDVTPAAVVDMAEVAVVSSYHVMCSTPQLRMDTNSIQSTRSSRHLAQCALVVWSRGRPIDTASRVALSARRRPGKAIRGFPGLRAARSCWAVSALHRASRDCAANTARSGR